MGGGGGGGRGKSPTPKIEPSGSILRVVEVMAEKVSPPPSKLSANTQF